MATYSFKSVQLLAGPPCESTSEIHTTQKQLSKTRPSQTYPVKRLVLELEPRPNHVKFKSRFDRGASQLRRERKSSFRPCKFHSFMDICWRGEGGGWGGGRTVPNRYVVHGLAAHSPAAGKHL